MEGSLEVFYSFTDQSILFHTRTAILTAYYSLMKWTTYHIQFYNSLCYNSDKPYEHILLMDEMRMISK